MFLKPLTERIGEVAKCLYLALPQLIGRTLNRDLRRSVRALVSEVIELQEPASHKIVRTALPAESAENIRGTEAEEESLDIISAWVPRTIICIPKPRSCWCKRWKEQPRLFLENIKHVRLKRGANHYHASA